MYKENLIESIRSEDVVIWAGAGVSIVPGYPSGDRLRDLLYSSLNELEQKEISPLKSLMDLSEDIVTIKGNRNHLIRTLQEIFLAKPNDNVTVHSKIASIPHFKTIITTNYDKLFEQSYSSDTLVISNEKHVPYIKPHEPHIIKIHGDFNDPDSIIITKSDYDNIFVRTTLENTIWGIVRERMLTKTILFLGYGTEDSNFRVIMEKISHAVGKNRKEFYLIAPELSALKQKELTKNNIHYIDTTAEEFMDEVIKSIQENIIQDLPAGKVGADTLRRFLLPYPVKPDLGLHKDRFYVKQLVHEEVIPIQTAFKIAGDEQSVRKIYDYLHSYPSKKLMIPGNLVPEISTWYAGIRMSHKDIQSLELIPVPAAEGKVDIIFQDGFCATLDAKLYRCKHYVDICIVMSAGTLNLRTVFRDNKLDVKLDIVHSEMCQDVDTEIEFYDMLKHLTEGKRFKIVLADGTIHHMESLNIDNSPDFESLFEFFSKIKRIERAFLIKFRNFAYEINKVNLAIVEKLIRIIDGEIFRNNIPDGIKLDFKDGADQQIESLLAKIDRENIVIKLIVDDKEFETLYNQKLDLGQKEVLIRKANDGKKYVIREGNSIHIKSCDNQASITYIIRNEMRDKI